MSISHPSNRLTNENLDDVFTYHPPSVRQADHYHQIREAGKYFASIILANTPGCADQSAALRSVRESVLWANAAVALDLPVEAPGEESEG